MKLRDNSRTVEEEREGLFQHPHRPRSAARVPNIVSVRQCPLGHSESAGPLLTARAELRF